MQKNQVKDAASVAVEGLEQRRFLSADPLMHFAPPAFGEGAGVPAPIMFDAAFVSAGRFPQGMGGLPATVVETQTSASAVAASASNTAAPEVAFNGYPAPAAAAVTGPTASGSMEAVHRAVDGAWVQTQSVRSETSAATVRTDAAVSTVEPAGRSASPDTAKVPDGQIVHPAAVFSGERIRSDEGVAGTSVIAGTLRSAEEQIACVVRLAWADIAYTNVGQSLGRLASDAGQALSRHAADAELAAAVVMGVAGAAWWLKQVEDEVAQSNVASEHSWIETVDPRPWVG